jgi:hypothetical protein
MLVLCVSVPAASAASWTVQKTQQPPLSAVSGSAYAVFNAVSCPSTTFCIAVGDYSSAGGGRTLAERWNGTTWAVQNTLNYQPVVSDVLDAVSCASPTACMAVGNYHTSSAYASPSLPLAEFWDGTSWTLEPVPNPASSYLTQLRGVSCSSATACTAVGLYPSGDNQVPLVETWDGSRWQIQAAPAASSGSSVLNSVSCVSSSACIAVGDDEILQLSTFAERWDGTSWTPQTPPNQTTAPGGDNFFNAVSCASASACVAAGGWLDNQHRGYYGLAEGWDGSNWTLQTVSPDIGFLSGLSCPSGSACVAVGEDNSGSAPVAAGWDGSSWTTQSLPTNNARLNAVSCASATACTAVGVTFKQVPFALYSETVPLALRYS